MAVHPGAGPIHHNSVNTVGRALMKAKYRGQGRLITYSPDQLRPPQRPAGMTRAHAPGEPVPRGLGEGAVPRLSH